MCVYEKFYEGEVFTAPACLQALEAAKEKRLDYDRTMSGAVYLNTPRLIEDQNQQPVWTWQQGEPFGDSVPNQQPASAGAFVFNLRYAGQYSDAETNTNYNYFRDYSPGGGTYLQSDPFGLKGGINPYAYVRGNPLSWVDPLGLLTINLTPNSDPANQQINNLPDDPSSVTIIAHGGYDYSSRYTGQLLGPDGQPLSADQLAYIIKNQPSYKEGMPIYLRSCGTGNGYGQELKKYFPKSTVYAPYGTVTPPGTTFWPYLPYAGPAGWGYPKAAPSGYGKY